MSAARKAKSISFVRRRLFMRARPDTHSAFSVAPGNNVHDTGAAAFSRALPQTTSLTSLDLRRTVPCCALVKLLVSGVPTMPVTRQPPHCCWLQEALRSGAILHREDNTEAHGTVSTSPTAASRCDLLCTALQNVAMDMKEYMAVKVKYLPSEEEVAAKKAAIEAAKKAEQEALEKAEFDAYVAEQKARAAASKAAREKRKQHRPRRRSLSKSKGDRRRSISRSRDKGGRK